MGRKNKNKKKTSVPRMIALQMDRKVDVPFRLYDATANAASLRVYALAAGSIPVSTTVVAVQGTIVSPSARLQTMCTQYTLFKFRRLKIYAFPSSDADYGIAYVPNGGGVTAPASITTLMELPHALLVVTEMTVPRALNIGKQALSGQLPWYRCDLTVDVSEYIQGYIFVRGGATSATPLVIEGVVSYKEPTNVGVALLQSKEQIIQEFLESRMIPSGSMKSPAIPRLN